MKRLKTLRHPRLAGVALLLIVMGGAGFYLGRWAIDSRVSMPDLGNSKSSETRLYLTSLEQAVHKAPSVFMVDVTGDPSESVDTSGRTSLLQENVEANVVRYLKGSGPPTVTVTRTKDITTSFISGETATNRAEGYVQLQKGHRYVLFVRLAPDNLWVGIGRPFGFEIINQELGAIDGTQPADWGLASLDDLTKRVQEILSSTATEPSTQLPTLPSTQVSTETALPLATPMQTSAALPTTSPQ